jgi:hypothetical protein
MSTVDYVEPGLFKVPGKDDREWLVPQTGLRKSTRPLDIRGMNGVIWSQRILL